MIPQLRKPVVVGIDGAASALDAVRWAAVEAQRRGTGLRVVCCDVFALVYLPDVPTVRLPESFRNAVAEQAAQWLQQARTAAWQQAPRLRYVRTFIRPGTPVPALLDESKRAQLVVVGSRGLGPVSGAFAGSVAVELSAHAECPVAIIRRPVATEPDAPVVVGVDGNADHALETAFECAAQRRAPLEAVHAWHTVGTARAWRNFHDEGRAAVLQREEERILDETLAPWCEKYLDVEVRRIVAQDKPARALLRHAQHAQLVVVGSRGRGAFAGLVLGATSQQLVHHAPCPLIVAG
ncbi:universal stress protein [Saccharopolyspora thermophila]|uniref:Universal stress protein n=1 Tax=Saccharopolyspora thermophila TaxID=89367 RepID=A0ABP3MX62_9PSEU